MYYLIEEVLRPTDKKEIQKWSNSYVAVIDSAEWKENSDIFDMGIDIPPDASNIYTTKAEVNFDSLTGTFSIPKRNDVTAEDIKFSFALDEKGIVFIDNSGEAQKMVETLEKTKKWRAPSLERFISDFLDQIIKDDLRQMENYEARLAEIEEDASNDDTEITLVNLNEIRGDLRILLIHYDQLMDLAQEFIENENGFFGNDELRYFRLFLSRLERLHATAASLRDYAMQIRDLYNVRLDIRQNRIMKVLTIVTTIFMPLTLIAGWYGMNFIHMPELYYKYSYPIVIAVSVIIVIVSILFLKKKKWL